MVLVGAFVQGSGNDRSTVKNITRGQIPQHGPPGRSESEVKKILDIVRVLYNDFTLSWSKRGKNGETVIAMKVSVILAHPNEASFNHAIGRTAVEQLQLNGHEVLFHDLYAEKFGPTLPGDEIPQGAVLPVEIARHCHEIAAAEGIVIVHPNWWGQPPAILKGWVDRVIRPGVAYEFLEGDSGEGVPNGLLTARAAIVFNTSNTEIEREKKAFGDPLETIWKNCIFGLCGVKDFYRKMFTIVVTSTEDQRRQWLDEVRSSIHTVFPPASCAKTAE